MSVEENKAIVGRRFTEFCRERFNPDVIDELTSTEIETTVAEWDRLNKESL